MDHDVFVVRYGLSRVIAEGWRQYRSLFPKIWPVVLAVYIPINFALSFVPADDMIASHGVRGLNLYMKLLQLTEFLVGVLATMATAKLVESSLRGEPMTWQAALRHALSRWGAVVWTGILGSLIVIGMYLLLIIPGIIWSLYYALVVYVVALRGLSGKRALDCSKAIVKGQWWRVFGYLFVIQLLNFVAAIVVSLPFLQTPDHRWIGIASDTLIDLVSALFLCMTIVFFLNNERRAYADEPPALPFQPPPLP